MKSLLQIQAMAFALLILAGANAHFVLAQEPVNAPPSTLNQGDRDTTLGPPAPESAVVLRFAIASEPLPGAKALSAQACPEATVDEPQSAVTVNPATLDLITAEFQKRLSKTMSVLVDVDPKEMPVGATVFSGCITRFVAGNNAKKMVGFNLGASHLGAHVIVLTKTQSGFSPIDSFDIAVKGGNILPPIGPIGVGVRIAKVSRETDSATAKKLAGQILKRLAKDRKTEANSAKQS